MKLEQIIKAVNIWVKEMQDNYPDMFKTEIVTNKSNAYRAIFDMKNCMAEVIVGEPSFAPYRNVAFEVVAMLNDKSNLVYSWYDTDEDDIDSTIKQLNIGLEKAMNL